MDIQKEIQKELASFKDDTYRKMQVKIIPSVLPESIIGVRTPELRKLAKKYALREDIDLFLNNLPHKYFEENQLHAFIVSGIKDYGECIKKVNKFLPYVDNWATCDQMNCKTFKQEKDALLDSIKKWIASKKTYSVRFGIKMLMDYFLDEDFDLEYPTLVSKISTEEYYVKMMIAWYFATALTKQYERALPFIEKRVLEPWTHNKAIQKATESFCIKPEQKEYLRGLKIKK